MWQGESEMADRAWGKNFAIDGAPDGFIKLAQRSPRCFYLGSSIEYFGDMGLDHLELSKADIASLRKVSTGELPNTDLASVPMLLRWWVNTYGVHTPAALIHDKLIGNPDKPGNVSDQEVDRYFRFMLKDLGVPLAKRWLMWTAVALRTRWSGGEIRQLAVAIWLLMAAVGSVVLALSLKNGSWVNALITILLPIPASLLWGRQATGGLIAAYFAAPWLLLPAGLAGLFLAGYEVIEASLARLFPDDSTRPPMQLTPPPPTGPSNNQPPPPDLTIQNLGPNGRQGATSPEGTV